jgi:hypothetical protein
MVKTIQMCLGALFIVLTVSAAVLAEDGVHIIAELSAEEVKPGEEITLTIRTETVADVYYISADVMFNPDAFVFVGAEAAGLMSGGLVIADQLNSQTVGTAITKTEPASEPGAGELIRLTFRATQKAVTGESLFTAVNVTLGDSNHEDIEVQPVESVYTDVLEVITHASIYSDAVVNIEEGNVFEATAMIYANGVTMDEENLNRLQVRVGVYPEDTDPASWPESAWMEMDFMEEDAGYFHYRANVADRREPGTWYVAVRAELDSDPGLKYGGAGGFWHETNHPSAVMNIEEQPPFRYTIAGWDFDDETLEASSGLPQNDGVQMNVEGAELSGNGFITGASGRAANANGWNEFDEDNPAYWWVKISTERLSGIQLSSKQSGTNTGPRDFQLQISTDGNTWSDVPGGAVTVANDFTTGVLQAVSLTEAADDRPELWIRWVQTSDIAINENGVSGNGTNRLDDVVITGINPDAERIEVWAGDTNNDGVVNEEDVLPLAVWWGTQGPESVYQTTDWEPRPAEVWIPLEATFADANGDGVVDHHDLRPVGINFGKSHVNKPLASLTGKVDRLPLPALQQGETVDVYLVSRTAEPLNGLSFNISLDGIDDLVWEVEGFTPAEWSDEWNASGSLLEFEHREGVEYSAASAYMGVTRPEMTDVFGKVTIRAVADWQGDPGVVLNRIRFSEGRSTYIPEETELSLTPGASMRDPGYTELPEHTELLQNFPNPFNPTTMINYRLSEPGTVRIEVYNTLGKRVSTLIETEQSAGSHTVSFDGSSLSSGIYFYQLHVNGLVQTRAMTLIK